MRAYVFVLAIALAPCFFLAVSAQQVDPQAEHARAERQLKELQKNIQQQQRQFTRQQTQLNQTEKKLRAIEQKVAHSTQTLQHTAQELVQLQKQIQHLQTEQTQLQMKLQQQAELLADQIETAYRSGQGGFFKLMLNQDQPGHFERLLEYYRYLNEARLKQLQALHQTENELLAVQQKLAEQQQTLAQRHREQEHQRHTLEAQQQQQQQQVALLKQAQADASNELQTLLQNEQELTELLAALAHVLQATNIQLSGLQQARGHLPWPLTGKVRHSFGEQRSSQVNWRGIVIDSPAETPVRSIADGRVLFADWLRGFGLVLVLDHGEGFMSLYGYNQALMFDVGEAVRAGEVISLVGQSGGQSVPGLYFEIRHRGDPVNPTHYLRR